MKFLLVYFLVVHISTVVCAYRRHGTSSRNSASFLLRKVCVEVAGLKEEIADLKEENADFKEEIADLKEENADLKEEIADLKEENPAMKQPVDGQWINWLQWSGCSVTCGPGTRTRQRLCLDPRPSNGGSNCTGSASETEDCEIINCEESSSPYSAFAIYGVSPTGDGSVAVWQSTKLNIAPDNGAHYNTSSGKYCAEFYGIYAFHLHLVKVSAANTAACAIQKDHAGSLETLAATTVNPGTVTSSISTIVDLERGDCVYAGECFAIDLLSSSTSFSGALLDPLE